MAVHGLWNALISLGAVGLTTDLFWLDLVLFPLEVLLVGIVFEVCVLDEARTIRTELDEEVVTGVLPEGHPRILSSWLRRLGRAWIPEGIDRHTYIELATTLAMRKRQARLLGDRAPAFYGDEVRRLRDALIRAHSQQPETHPARAT
jgi:hypothetical protein